ncbi:MAG TPA: glycosyltransferase family 9 protein [Azospira sp.]|nr:glycosyltransferase family 9 protein [Azospira sp.]
MNPINPISLPPKAKILVVRKDNIGDLVCITPLIRALRQRFPDAHLAALVNSYNGPVLAGNPDLDEVHAYTKSKHRGDGQTLLGVYWQRLKLMVKLRLAGYDLAILASCSFVPSAFRLAQQVGPRRILSFVTGEQPGLERKVSDPVPYHPDPLEHETERAAKLLLPLGIEPPYPPARVFADTERQARMQARLSAAGFSPESRPVAVHISARKVGQRWSEGKFIELMKNLHQRLGCQFMLFWSPGDENNPFHPGDDGKAARILAGLPGVPVFPCPTEQLEDLIAGLSCCSSMICSDGGAMHLGAGLGLPIVCFFGNSEANKWHPWGVPYELLQKDSQVVEDITVDETLAAYDRLQQRLAQS